MTAAQGEGLVLCLVGPCRLAVAAVAVGAITEDDGAAPWAGRLFALPPAPATARRVLQLAQGPLAVDEVTVEHQPCTVLPVPVALGPRARAGVRGFALLADTLWPVLDPAGVARLLEPSP